MSWRIGVVLAIGVLPLLAVSVSLPWPVGSETTTAVVIEAVLYDGYETGDADEAVRLRNVSDAAVDITGWQLNDGESATAVITLSTILAPEQSLWLAKDGTAFARQFGHLPDFERNDSRPDVPNLDGSWPNLANSGDQVMLLDPTGFLVDCLAYEGDNDGECGSAWHGEALQPYRPSTSFGAEGQILYRRRQQTSGRLVPDSDRAADWAQGLDDVINGRKVMYPGWDLDSFFFTQQLTETAVLTIAVAPDNAYETLVAEIERAQSSIQIETQTFENLAIADSLIEALHRGVTVTILMEAEPAGGVSDQEIYICQQLAAAGGACWFMFNESDLDIADRYTFLHAKFIIIDDRLAVIASENLSPRSLPYDDKQDGTSGRRGVLLLTDAPGVVAHLETIFARDFDHEIHRDITGTHILGELPPGFVPLTATGGTSYTVRYAAPTVFKGSFAFEIMHSPENSLRDEDGLLGMMGQAGAGDTVLVQQLLERPYWGASSSNATADPNPRLEAALSAARRGARVRLMLDAYFDRGDATSNSAACDYVNKIGSSEGIDIACKTANPTGLGIHNKMVLVEAGGRGMIHVGSINGSELSSKGNRELALQVQSDEAYRYLASMFWVDWGQTVYLPFIHQHSLPPARHVLISEILYDPPGAVDDAEFIELVNPTNFPVDLGGYGIGDAVSPEDFEDVRRFPAATQIPPNGLLVIAVAATSFAAEFGFPPDFEILDTDENVPDLIDDPDWGDEDAFLRLGNAGDEVILRDPADQISDVLTYGTSPMPGVIPCPAVTLPGAGLERFPYYWDTDNCPIDFREWAFPNPGSFPANKNNFGLRN